jgi:RimJ/RimL family protein N-acetyltransferase
MRLLVPDLCLSSERLKYKITDINDVDALHETINTPEMAARISFLTYPCPVDKVLAWVERAQAGIEQGTEWLFSVFLDGAYIGSINLHDAGGGVSEIGYWLHRDYQGQGYGHEMLSFILDYAFSQLKFKTVFATTALNNYASQKILRKAGFTETGQVFVETGDGSRASMRFELST